MIKEYTTHRRLLASEDLKQKALAQITDVVDVETHNVKRFKYFTFELYPDCPWQMTLLHNFAFMKDYYIVYILHDKDVKEWTQEPQGVERVDGIECDITSDETTETRVNADGTIEYAIYKKPHYHVMLKCCSTSKSKRSFADEFAIYAPTWQDDTLAVNDHKAMLRYFVHRTTKSVTDGKHLYDIDELITNDAFWINAIDKIEDTKGCSQTAFIRFMRSLANDNLNLLDARLECMANGFLEFTQPKYAYFFKETYNLAMQEHARRVMLDGRNSTIDDFVTNQTLTALKSVLKRRCEEFSINFIKEYDIQKCFRKIWGLQFSKMLQDSLYTYCEHVLNAHIKEDIDIRISEMDSALDSAFSSLKNIGGFAIYNELSKNMADKNDYKGFNNTIRRFY